MIFSLPQMAEIMDEMEEFDFSFFTQEDGIKKFVDDLYAFHVLVMRNEDKTMKVVQVMCAADLLVRMNEFFTTGEQIVQMTIVNEKQDPFCPYFTLYMSGYDVTKPINFKLETFFRVTGTLGIHARCQKALVMGMMSQVHTNSMIDIPQEYHLLPSRPTSLHGVIDLYPYQSIARNRCLDKLMNVPGMELPLAVPSSLHWNIFKFLRHPCAQMILDHRQRMLMWMSYWDRHFDIIFHSVSAW
jgi:hypothetical protein